MGTSRPKCRRDQAPDTASAFPMTLASTRTRRRAGSRRVQRDHPRSPIRRLSNGTTRRGKGSRFPARCSTKSTSARSRPMARGGRRRRACRSCASSGVTVIQMMPVAEFAGDFGWGYDGVQWFAPMHTYGTPADLQHFVDTAHQLGLGVILDVVYNHLGPSGNFLPRFSPHYFTDRHKNEWGTALNFDDERAHGMRELVLTNVDYWIREFHLDGFRLDAAQQLFDSLVRAHPHGHCAGGARRRGAKAGDCDRRARTAARAADAAGGRRRLRAGWRLQRGLPPLDAGGAHRHSRGVPLRLHRQQPRVVGPRAVGLPLPGQYYPWQSAPRGAPALDRPSHQFVAFIENHDQVANLASGRRLIEADQPVVVAGDDGVLAARPVDAVAVPGPGVGIAGAVPLFRRPRPRPAADGAHRPAGVHRSVRAERRPFMTPKPPPAPPSAARRSRRAGRSATSRSSSSRTGRCTVTCCGCGATTRHSVNTPCGSLGATLGDQSLALRFTGRQPHDDRLLILNLSPDLNIAATSEPLCAPPESCAWSVLWCSEDPRYGGVGSGCLRSAQGRRGDGPRRHRLSPGPCDT